MQQSRATPSTSSTPRSWSVLRKRISMLIYSVTPYEDHLGTSTRQRLGEGSGAKVKSPTAARSVLEITGRSRAAQDNSHCGFFRRRDHPASHPSLWLPHEPGCFSNPAMGYADSRRHSACL